MEAKFISNKSKTAFAKCDEIKNEEEFYSSSPYSLSPVSPGPKKTSNRIFKSELGNKRRTMKLQKPYYGGKPYIISRIAYNKCIPNARSKERIWHQYNDFANHFEAFSAANEMFKGEYSSNLRVPASTGAGAGGQSSSFPFRKFKSSQLSLSENDFQTRLRELSNQPQILEDVAVAAVPTSTGREEMRRRFSHATIDVPRPARIEKFKQGENRYVAYPNSNVYFQCPSRQEALKTASELNLFFQKYIEEQRKFGNTNLSDKITYCGFTSTMRDFLKAKMCGLIREDEEKKLGLPLQNLKQLGSPSHCYQYGKIWKTREGKSDPVYAYTFHDYPPTTVAPLAPPPQPPQPRLGEYKELKEGKGERKRGPPPSSSSSSSFETAAPTITSTASTTAPSTSLSTSIPSAFGSITHVYNPRTESLFPV